MSANSSLTVDNVFEAHSKLAMIVTIEVEESEVSLFAVQVLQFPVGGCLFDSILVKRNIDLLSRLDVTEVASVPKRAKWFTSFANRIAKRRP